MVIKEAGYLYLVENYEGGGTQQIQFLHKETTPEKTDGSLNLIKNGTTNEELLKVLINRLQYLNTVLPSRENSIVITKLEESLMWLNKRAMDREARGVLGTGNK